MQKKSEELPCPEKTELYVNGWMDGKWMDGQTDRQTKMNSLDPLAELGVTKQEQQ